MCTITFMILFGSYYYNLSLYQKEKDQSIALREMNVAAEENIIKKYAVCENGLNSLRNEIWNIQSSL